jgi:hypothetical protein
MLEAKTEFGNQSSAPLCPSNPYKIQYMLARLYGGVLIGSTSVSL